MDEKIQAPLTKVIGGLGIAAGSSATSVLVKTDQFLPKDLAGWLAVAASGFAVGYTATLWAEWWWKRFWKPFLQRRRWLD